MGRGRGGARRGDTRPPVARAGLLAPTPPSAADQAEGSVFVPSSQHAPDGRVIEAANGVTVVEHPTGGGGDRRYRLIYSDGSEHVTGYWPDFRRALVTAPPAPAGARLVRVHHVPRPGQGEAWPETTTAAARAWLAGGGLDASLMDERAVRAALNGRYDGGEESFRRRHESSDPRPQGA